MTIKKQLEDFKKKVKSKHKTIKRFSIAVGMDEYALRKLLMRIYKNSGKYVTNFDPQEELQKLTSLLNNSKNGK